MSIDPTTGELRVDDGKVLIGPSLRKEAFIRSGIGHQTESRVDNPPYNTYSIRLKDGDNSLGVTLAFNRQQIEMIAIEKLERERSWRNWSEALELRLKAEYDSLLSDMLGKPPYRYDWGEVVSRYDPRSGSSAIIINYV